MIGCVRGQTMGPVSRRILQYALLNAKKRRVCYYAINAICCDHWIIGELETLENCTRLTRQHLNSAYYLTASIQG